MTINNKKTIRIVLISSFIFLNVLLLFGLSTVIDYLNTGADRSSMLHLEKETVNKNGAQYLEDDRKRLFIFLVYQKQIARKQ